MSVTDIIKYMGEVQYIEHDTEIKAGDIKLIVLLLNRYQGK